MRFVLLAATVVLAGGCDRPAPPPAREEAKETFSGFQTGGTPEPLKNAADPSVSSRAEQSAPIPTPALAPEAQAATEDYSKALRDLRSDPAVRPSGDFDVTQNPGALQNLNNAIIGHMQQIEAAQDRVRAAMNPQERKAWATKKKEIDEGD